MFNYVILYKLKNKHLLTYLLTTPNDILDRILSGLPGRQVVLDKGSIWW